MDSAGVPSQTTQQATEPKLAIGLFIVACLLNSLLYVCLYVCLSVCLFVVYTQQLFVVLRAASICILHQYLFVVSH